MNVRPRHVGRQTGVAEVLLTAGIQVDAVAVPDVAFTQAVADDGMSDRTGFPGIRLLAEELVADAVNAFSGEVFDSHFLVQPFFYGCRLKDFSRFFGYFFVSQPVLQPNGDTNGNGS